MAIFASSGAHMSEEAAAMEEVNKVEEEKTIEDSEKVDTSPLPGMSGIPIFGGKPLKPAVKEDDVEPEVRAAPQTPEKRSEEVKQSSLSPSVYSEEKDRLRSAYMASPYVAQTPSKTPTQRGKKTASVRSGSATATAAIVSHKPLNRKPPADQRGCVFKSNTQRFRTGDVMASGGVPLISSVSTPDEEPSKMGGKRALRDNCKGSPPRYGMNIQMLRKRYSRPVRHAVERWGDKAECIGKATCSATCMTVADSTVWCAESDGTITIREKDGSVFAVVERDHHAPQITSLLYIASGNKGGRVLVGHANGTVLALDAITAERLTNDALFHSSAVTCLAAVYHANTSSLVVSTAKDGTMQFFDGHTLEVLQTVAHPAAVNCVVASGPYTYTGCQDGCVRKWDTQTGVELSSNALSGPVRDIMLDGRYLWCCAEGAQQLTIIDVTTMSPAAHPHPPTTAAPVKVLHMGSSTWTLHNDNSVVVWNSQSQGNDTIYSACKVQTVPEDYEVWTLSEGRVQMWRNHEYPLPIWCNDAYQAWMENVNEVKDEVAQLKATVALKNEKIAQLEGLNERLKEDLVQANQLQVSVQSLATTRSQEVGVENERRKKLEAELSDLRQVIIEIHKEITPADQHLLHYKPSDLKSIVGWLANEYTCGAGSLPQQDGAESELHQLLTDIHKKLTPPEDHEDTYSTSDYVGIVRLLQARAANPEVQQMDTNDTIADLTAQNHNLKEDNTRLKEMLEKLKLSHKRVNAQLQSITQQHS